MIIGPLYMWEVAPVKLCVIYRIILISLILYMQFITIYMLYILIANAAILGFKGEIDESLPTPRRKCEFTLFWLLLFIYFVCCMLDLKLHSLIYVH